jgi:predicted regulator of Ras-like GTPase activity (Roadblock/LC7/MglB family)
MWGCPGETVMRGTVVPQEYAPSPIDDIIELRGVEGAFEITEDGFLLRAVQSCTEDPEAVAAAIATAMRLWQQIGMQLDLGSVRWLLLEFGDGKMIIGYTGGRMIVVFGSPRMIDGEVLAQLHPEA